MNPIKTSIMIFGLICIFISSQAQTKKVRKPKEYVYPSNVIKLNTTSLLFKTVALQYERKLASRWSFAMGVIYRPSSKLLYYDMIGQDPAAFGISASSGYSYSTLKNSRLSITPEFRYYFKKKSPRGLYLSPFFKYQVETEKMNYKYFESKTNPGVEKIGDFTLTNRSMGVGVLFGYQVLTVKKLAIDFWFLGPWFGNQKSKINSKLNIANMEQLDQNLIASSLEEISGVPVKFNNSGINNFSNGYKFGVRFIGVNIGYNF